MGKTVYQLEGGEKLNKKQFLEYFERKVRKTIRVHKLTEKKEKIIVACSGGKDSTVALYILNKAIKSRNVFVEAIHIDISLGEYSKINRRNIINFCKRYKIPLHLYSFKKEFGYTLKEIQERLRQEGINWRNCAVCGILKRYLLNKCAKELKANKLATGHNLDDETQSIIMNLFRNNTALLARLGPKTGVAEFSGFISRIKPLYMLPENEVKLFSKLMRFTVLYKSCPYRKDSYRKSVLEMLNEFDEKYKGTKHGIINSYLEISPMLKMNYNEGSVKKCKSCGEPAAGSICNACRIIEMIS